MKSKEKNYQSINCDYIFINFKKFQNSLQRTGKLLVEFSKLIEKSNREDYKDEIKN